MTKIVVNTDTNTLVSIIPDQTRAELHEEALMLERELDRREHRSRVLTRWLLWGI